MTNARLADIDARLHRAFARAGLADSCTYTTTAGTVIADVRCFVRRGIQLIGDEGQVTSNSTVIDLVRTPEFPRPLHRDSIVIGSETFNVESILAADESKYTVSTVKERAR